MVVWSTAGVDSSEAAVSLARENAGMLAADCDVAFVKEECESYMKEAAARGETWDIVVLGPLFITSLHISLVLKVMASSGCRLRLCRIVADPPKLAPNKGALNRAKRKYVKLNSVALRLLAPGGLLMTCSCSGAVAQGDGLLPLVKVRQSYTCGGLHGRIDHMCGLQNMLSKQFMPKDMPLQEAALGAGRKVALLRSAGAALDHPLDPAYPEGQYLTNLLFRVI